MTRLLSVVGAISLTGCGGECGDLVDVPVTGGTPTQQAAARDTLADFDRWLQDPVCVPHVAFTKMNPGGRYNTVTRGIRVNDDTDWECCAGWFLGHELSHAAHTQNDLNTDIFRGSDGRHPRERFADLGGMGSDSLNLLLHSGCALGPADQSAVEDVSGALFLPRAGVAGAHRWEIEGSTSFSMEGDYLTAFVAGEGTSLCLDGGGGSRCVRISGAGLVDWDADPKPTLQQPLLHATGFQQRLGLRRDGLEHLVLSLGPVLPLGTEPVVDSSVWVLATVDADADLVATTCLDADQVVVAVDGELLLVEADRVDNVVRWSRLVHP